MKKLLTIVSIFICAQSFGQGIYQSQNSYGFQYKHFKIDSTLHIPTFCGVPTLRGSVVGNQGAIGIDSCNKKLYFYDPKDSSWNIVSGSGSTIIAGYLIKINSDTISIDTAALFNVALRKSFADSVAYRTVTFPDSTGYWVLNWELDTISTHYFVGGGVSGGTTLQQAFDASISSGQINPMINAHGDSLIIDSLNKLAITNYFSGHAFSVGFSNVGFVPSLTFWHDNAKTTLSGNYTTNNSLSLPDTSGRLAASLNYLSPGNNGNIFLPINNIKRTFASIDSSTGITVPFDSTITKSVLFMESGISPAISKAILPLSTKYSSSPGSIYSSFNKPEITISFIKKGSSTLNYITTTTGDNINGGVDTTISFKTPNESYTFTSDGTGWKIINHYIPQLEFDSTVTLSSGTITVSDTRVHTGARIFLSVNTPSGTQGFLSAKTSDIVDGTSFIINSTSATETSTVNYEIINP